MTKTGKQLDREIAEVLQKDAPPCLLGVGDFVSFKSKHDGSTIKGRIVELAWLSDHWSAMVKMAGHPGNAILRVSDLTVLPKRAR
jgi:hypothetical protein